MVYIVEVGEFFKVLNGEEDVRLCVIYFNGMESNILLCLFIWAMYKDEMSCFVIDFKLGGLFFGEISEDD